MGCGVACAQGPQLLIVVPTRELGVQTVLLIYKLFGGSVHAGIPGDPTNMFSYTGPRGIRVRRSCSISHACTAARGAPPFVRLLRRQRQ